MIARALVAAIVLNLAILIAPVAVFGRLPAMLDDPALWAFLAVASAMVLADAPTIGRRPTIDGEGKPEDREAKRLAAATGCLILAIFWSSLLERSIGARGSIGAGNQFGGALMIAGVALRAAAVRSLGSGFITEPGSGPLIDRGLYAWIRHPSEAGNLAASFGAACLLGSYAGSLMTALTLTPLVLFRIRIEDAGLRARHGERFESHARLVGALIPRFRGTSPAPSPAAGATGRDPAPAGGSAARGACGPAIRGSRWWD